MHDARRFASLVALCGLVFAAVPAQASFHLMKVVEVFPGTAAAPGAQYVVLQMYAADQDHVAGKSITVSDANGVTVGTFTFPSNVAVGLNQSKLLIATPAAATFFGVSADLTMSASLPLAGGKVCFGPIDCVGWGSYAPPGADTAVGTPFNSNASPVAGEPVRGLVSGKAIKRRLDIGGGATTLNASDDTDDSANDFRLGTPTPVNNAGQTGSVPASICGNGALEALEACDDAGTQSGDGCSATCIDEFCGDLVINDGDETCEPPNVGVCGPTCVATIEFTPVDWATSTTGRAGAVGATLQSIAGSQLGSDDLSGADYSAAALSASAETLDYDTSSDWRFAISRPAQSILLYTVDWRGASAGINPVVYDFDAPFTILSGLEGALVENAGTRLVLAADAYYSGILQFVGPISSVALGVNSISSAQQSMTFALVPEPANGTAVAFAAIIALKLRTRRGRR